jgi:flagellar capping protein FliD
MAKRKPTNVFMNKVHDYYKKEHNSVNFAVEGVSLRLKELGEKPDC